MITRIAIVVTAGVVFGAIGYAVGKAVGEYEYESLFEPVDLRGKTRTDNRERRLQGKPDVVTEQILEDRGWL
ncbi:MAG: hypothetical protein AAF126_01920 [Chloroflexota bacterium]